MGTYRIDFTIQFDGSIEVEADAESDACDEFHGLADADLVADGDLEFGCAIRRIVEVTGPPAPLEQLAEQAE